MQNEYCVTSIITSSVNKQVIIETNFKVDETSVNNENVKLINSEHGLQETYDLSVNNKNIIITLTDWPKNDIIYKLSIKDIKDMLNRQLRNSVNKKIEFKTNIKTKSYLSSPVNNQAIKTTNVSLVAELEKAMPEENETLDYRFEISSDVAFFNITNSISTKFNSYDTILNPGQYFARTRLESSETKEYSDWSEVISFVVINESDLSESNECEHSEIVEDILSETDFFVEDFVEDLIIIDRTPNGITQEEFYIYLNKKVRMKKPKIDDGFNNDLIKIGETIGYRKDL